MKKNILVVISIFFTFQLFAQFPPDSVWIPGMPSDFPKPGYLETVLDTNHDINYIRISDAEAFGYPEGSGEILAPYSKTQVWNADMSKLFIGFTNILDAEDYTIIKSLSGLYPGGYYNDARWSNVDPNIRYFCWNDNFLKINIETDVIDTLQNFPGYDATIGPWEGNISADDKYVVITNSGHDKATLYDIELDEVISSIEFFGDGFDWASMTPSGDYIAVSNSETGHVELYNYDFEFIRILVNDEQHADFAIDTNGDEVLVQVVPLSMTRLSDGHFTDLIDDALVCGNYHFDPNIAGHISGRNLNLPGWALVSTQIGACSSFDSYYYITEMFAIKLDGSGTIRRYGHAHTTCTSYDSYSKASFSPDGTKVIFSSDWNLQGSGSENVHAYVAEFNDFGASIEESNKSINITLFPNPTNSSFIIQSNQIDNCTFELYTSLGTKVNTYTNKEIDISNLSNGIYILVIKDVNEKPIYYTKISKN